MNEKDFAETATRYRRFAEKEARGRSPLYEKFACCIAHDRELLTISAFCWPPSISIMVPLTKCAKSEAR
jgi:hypothetical protein